MSPASRRTAPEANFGLGHLARRFFAVVRARSLSDEETQLVRKILAPSLQTPFFEQGPADQRHGVEAASRVIAMGIDEPEAVVAALLHDIGKRHSGLGVPGRVVASLMIKMRLPLPRRFRVYRDHGGAAAEELSSLGAPTLAVEFARHHHGPRPTAIDPALWKVLIAADEPAKTREGAGAGISSTGR